MNNSGIKKAPNGINQCCVYTKHTTYYQDTQWKAISLPHILDLSIIEAVWDQLDGEQNKSQPTSKKNYGICFKKPGELFLKTVKRNYKKVCVREFTVHVEE